jgi:hypothetical protein
MKLYPQGVGFCPPHHRSNANRPQTNFNFAAWYQIRSDSGDPASIRGDLREPDGLLGQPVGLHSSRQLNRYAKLASAIHISSPVWQNILAPEMVSFKLSGDGWPSCRDEWQSRTRARSTAPVRLCPLAAPARLPDVLLAGHPNPFYASVSIRLCIHHFTSDFVNGAVREVRWASETATVVQVGPPELRSLRGLSITQRARRAVMR